MPDRIIGVLGGMGPDATADMFREITRLTPADVDQDHVRVIIYSNPKIPDRTEAILNGGESPVGELVSSARMLERGGAGIIVMPCNAAHYFLPELQEQVSTPILSMIEETCKIVRRKLPGVRRVGLLAALGTVKGDVYGRVFKHQQFEILVPPDADQRNVYSAIQQVKSGSHGADTASVFSSTGAALVAEGAEAVILGCTEIPMVFDEERVDYPTLNPTRILAQAAVDWALGRRQ